ncbi:hypothetical protein [Rosistilla oblonga]|uniref:hypothetical protein n=1 Tax=Rosistilla oblonga TaxID=2527990 RepID=UPI003A97FF69
MRTSKTAIFIRATVIVFIIYMMIAWAWNSMTNTNFWKPSEMAISAVLTVLLFGGFAWAVTNFGMALLYGRSSQYHQWKQTGGDPYFDSLPWPLNTDSRQVRETGMAEPRTSFVPPASWEFQCPVCGAKQPSLVCVCWNCNYGADGDSTAYFERFGSKPDEISEQEWAEIRSRHGV